MTQHPRAGGELTGETVENEFVYRLEGRGVVTQDAGGLAQKGGATWSHIQIAARPDATHTTKVDTAQADLVIACDAIVGAAKYTMTVMQHGRTYVALNTHGTPTAAFVRNPDWQFPGTNCEAAVRASVGGALVRAFDAEQVAVRSSATRSTRIR